MRPSRRRPSTRLAGFRRPSREVLIAISARARMLDAAIGADTTETGGILVGVYSKGTPLITHALEVPPQNPSRNRFQIPAVVTHLLVDCVRRVDPRLGYLGEWHTHPANVGTSNVDLSTMRRISS